VSGKKDPIIGVCALNPHAGENGTIGSEEKEVIEPAILNVKSKYDRIIGPVPADTIFYHALRGKFDIVIGMYHDQCLAPFKMVDFDNGVNMTLGLGCVRTSPDHGTAYDIAGKGIASCESMINAIKLAVRATTD
jgi:4-hydroxythreonine-4-phosphate dehydrogenase